MDAAHGVDILTSIALVTTAAVLGGLILTRLRQPAIVGYILAGVVLGPTGFSLVSNTESVQILAELGVIMLLFLIGMELSLRAFKSVYKLALLTAFLQIAISLGFFWFLGRELGWQDGRILTFGFAVALSSTAVSIKILEETDDLRNAVGRVTVSVLIAQDLAVIPMLLIIGAMGGGGENVSTLIIIKLLASCGFLAALTWFLSRRERIVLPFSNWIASKPEIIPLTALACCFSLAAISGLLGLSTAFGAFVAGLIIGNSNARASMHQATEPVQTVLLMVFFLSIGLLIDIDFIRENITTVLTVLGVVTVLKTVVNIGILHLLGEPWNRSFQSGVTMAQVGEFSFVIVAAGLTAGIISLDGYRTMIAVIALSLLISPMWLAIARKLHDMTARKLTHHFGGGK